MQIDEIVDVYGGGINLESINRVNEEKIGFIADYNFMKSENYYYLLDNNTIIGALTGEKINHCNKKLFVIYGVTVIPNYRGMVLGSQMYNYIMHYTGCNLMSDNEHSGDGRKLWRTIARTHNVKVLDLLTCDVVSSNIDDAYNNKHSLVLITLNKLNKGSPLIPTFRKGEVK